MTTVQQQPKHWAAKHEAALSRGDRIADAVTRFLGSWTFIILQAGLMGVWGLVNTLALFSIIRFDAYPFVFLNLFMSAEAAFSTPLILMSSNRQSDRDRVQSEDDYRTNKDAEQRIEELQIVIARLDNEKHSEILKAIRLVQSKAAKIEKHLNKRK